MVRRTAKFHADALKAFYKAKDRLDKKGEVIDDYGLFYLGFASGSNYERKRVCGGRE